MKLEIPVAFAGENLGWDFVTANECQCGGTPSLRKTAANDEATLYYFKCLKCGAMGYWSKKIETAVKNWNDGEKIYFLGGRK